MRSSIEQALVAEQKIAAIARYGISDGEPLNGTTWKTSKGELRLRAPLGWGGDSPRWATVELIEPVECSDDA